MAPPDLRAADSMARAQKNSEYLGCPHLFWPPIPTITRKLAAFQSKHPAGLHRNTGIQKPPEKKGNIDCVSLFNR